MYAGNFVPLNMYQIGTEKLYVKYYFYIILKIPVYFEFNSE